LSIQRSHKYYDRVRKLCNFSFGSDSHKCDAGFVCILGSAIPYPIDGTIGKICAVGKKCPKGALAEEPCSIGTYNPYEGQGDCLPCPAGKLCDTTGMSIFINCPKGNYCEQGVSGTKN
jgi:hypothetical protein